MAIPHVTAVTAVGMQRHKTASQLAVKEIILRLRYTGSHFF